VAPPPLHSRAPGSPLDAALAAHLQTERAERLRWNGTLLMYSPVLPFMVMICGLIESAAASGGIGPSTPPPPWYVMIPMAVAMIGLFVSVPCAVVGVVMRMAGSLRLGRACTVHHVDALEPWPAVGPGERIGPLLVEEVTPGRLSLVYLPAPRLVWKIMGFCAAGIFTSTLILVGVQVIIGAVGPRDIFAAAWCGLMLIVCLGFFGTRRLSFESSTEGPVFTSRYRFPGVPYWFTKSRPLIDAADDETVIYGRDAQMRSAASLLSQSGVRWGLDSGAFGAWKLRRLERTVAQCLNAASAD
jgi:hypothetical protein